MERNQLVNQWCDTVNTDPVREGKKTLVCHSLLNELLTDINYECLRSSSIK